MAMSKRPGPMWNPQDLDYLLYSSLLIFGLDVAALEHRLKASVALKSFSRIDKRLGDTILHFLFVYLDHEKAAKVFRDCWPLLDKKHEAQFHKATFEWYKSLQQSYRQPVPSVMVKTFMAPGGPKFTSTLLTLTRMALHSSVTKRASTCTLLNAPSYSRSHEQNWHTYHALQASKVKHCQNYIAKQIARQRSLLHMRNKARELCGRYRRLCKEGERTAAELSEAMANDERLTQSQREMFTSVSLPTMQKAILDDNNQMNEYISKLWTRVDQFHEVEGSAWRVCGSLLDGSAFLSHIDGSAYSPQVPDIVYKSHAKTVNKLKLEGLYRDGKIDLLRIVQSSSLALMMLLDTLQDTHSNTGTDFSEKLQAQSLQVMSVGETMKQLSEKLSSLLPTLSHLTSATHSNSIFNFTSTSERVTSEKSDLWPPTPPFTLCNNAVCSSLKTSHTLLQHTPDMIPKLQALPEDWFDVTPRRLLCGMGMIRACKRNPKPNVTYSSVSCKDDCVKLSEDTMHLPKEGLSWNMLTADLRGKYQRKEEELHRKDQRPHQMYKDVGNLQTKDIPERRLRPPTKTVICKVPVKLPSKPTQPSKKETNMAGKVSGKVEHKNSFRCNDDQNHCTEDLLIEKMASGIVKEGNYFDDEKEATESHSKQISNKSTWKTSLDSGCEKISEEFETLIDTLMDMNIIKKSKLIGSRSSSPRSFQTQNGAHANHLQNRSLKASVLLEETLSKLNTPQLGRFIQHHPSNASHMVGEESFVTSDQQKTPLTSQEKNEFIVTSKSKRKDPIKGIQGKLQFVGCIPPENNQSPLENKIPDMFDGVVTSPVSSIFTSRVLSEIPNQGKTINELKSHSKARLDLFLELQHSGQKDKKHLEENAQANKSKPNFLSYVEKLKKYQIPVSSENGNVKVDQNEIKKVSRRTNNENIIPSVNNDSHLTENVSKEYYENFARIQNLLNLEDTTLTEFNTQDIQESPKENEVFVNATDMSHAFEAQRQSHSSLLPETSVFDTVTDSILGGELGTCLLTDKNIGEQIHRESISSRRQSIANMRRLSLDSNKHLFDSPVFDPDECSWILDESDDCLLPLSSGNI